MITPQEAYAIACTLHGKTLPEIEIAPLWRSMLHNAASGGVEGRKVLQRSITYLFDGDTLKQVLGVDLDAPPPAPPPKPAPQSDSAPETPPLPKGVRLTAAQEREASKVGHFERRYTTWASAVANQTPVAYHRACGITLLAIAIGRRAYLATPWQQHVYPNQYVILLGTTTYYRKSTAMNVMRRIIEEAFPYLLMPRPGSTENFSNMLAGKWDTDGMPLEDKEELDAARPFAGQRAIFRDEISGLFRSFGRDHMAGLKEDLMDMYEGPRQHKLSTNSKGIVIARNIAPTLIGASTPAGMSAAVSPQDWEDGNLARFLLITPEQNYGDRPHPTTLLPADDFVTLLRELHQRLPHPPSGNALGKADRAEEWSLVAPIWDEVIAYANALRDMTNPRRADALDNRLRGTYGRHHVKALKVAITLAVSDWFMTQSKEERPTVNKAHWYRAQQLAEEWRESAHRFLLEMTISEDAEAGSRVFQCIARSYEGLTMSDLINLTRLKTSLIKQSLEHLMESGRIESFKQRRGGRGPEAVCYRAFQNS
ncbi:MAG: DUF3987 domain-containing protein [Anaerolineae bacterium]|nr:DUF3987 domain-containing protein [Anaerolineae bacterium]